MNKHTTTEPSWPIDQSHWLKTKIVGAIAEAACQSHFEALGYAVEHTGIEHIAPVYCRNIHDKKGTSNYSLELKTNFDRMPDFLASRVNPESGKLEALLIECKFRSSVNLAEFDQECDERYDRFIADGKHGYMLVYLVALEYCDNLSSETQQGPVVFLNLLGRGKNHHGHGWWKADELIDYPIYRGQLATQNFKTAYQEIVLPALRQIARLSEIRAN